jgi:hypothetical protein
VEVIIFVVGSRKKIAVHDGVAKQGRLVTGCRVAAELAGGVFEGVTRLGRCTQES